MRLCVNGQPLCTARQRRVHGRKLVSVNRTLYLDNRHVWRTPHHSTLTRSLIVNGEDVVRMFALHSALPIGLQGASRRGYLTASMTEGVSDS
jgi:hypothetical protein